MYILKVKKKGNVEQSDFASKAELDAHVKKLKESGYLGREEYSEEVDGKIVNYPAEYELEIQDKTAEEVAAKAKKDEKKSKRDARIAKLKAFDMNKVKTIADLKEIVQDLMDEVYKDVE